MGSASTAAAHARTTLSLWEREREKECEPRIADARRKAAALTKEIGTGLLVNAQEGEMGGALGSGAERGGGMLEVAEVSTFAAASELNAEELSDDSNESIWPLRQSINGL